MFQRMMRSDHELRPDEIFYVEMDWKCIFKKRTQSKTSVDDNSTQNVSVNFHHIPLVSLQTCDLQHALTFFTFTGQPRALMICLT